jgi:hypothetical protein
MFEWAAIDRLGIALYFDGRLRVDRLRAGGERAREGECTCSPKGFPAVKE